jgi:2-iminoacetate synthase ThiH
MLNYKNLKIGDSTSILGAIENEEHRGQQDHKIFKLQNRTKGIIF